MLELTRDQKERLSKLEEEIASKKLRDEKDRERRCDISKKTGIPVDLVDMDIVKIGSMLGLINLRSSEKNDDDINIINLLLDGMSDDTKVFDYSNIPPYFSLSPTRISEDDRLEYQKEEVRIICKRYYEYVNNVLMKEREIIERYMSFDIEEPNIEKFYEFVFENMNAVFEIIVDEDSDESWEQLHILRNALLNVVSICEYNRILTSQITELLKYYPYDKICRNLSYVDSQLTLSPFLRADKSVDRVLNSLIIRSHSKDPELKAIDIKKILKECCTPSLLFVDLKFILAHGIIGPYRNNPICFVHTNYYVLKDISSSGVRIWIMDDGLRTFSDTLRSGMMEYTKKLRDAFHQTIPDALVENIRDMDDEQSFNEVLRVIIRQKSVLNPSEADVFDIV